MPELVIAEKPSVAQAIAAVLGSKERKDGFLIGGGYIVSWCFGHLVELAQPAAYDEKYAKWRCADLPIIPEQWRYAASPDKKKQLDILAALMKRPDVEAVINACDAGREGELIFRLVYNFCKCTKPIKRLWISSMEESAIAEGFHNLKDGVEYENLYRAALCRSQADWLVGLNATRLFTVLYNSMLSVGRVQSPTLALLTGREAEITAFVKKPFYVPELHLGEFTASGEKMKDKAEAESICAACDGKDAVAASVEKQEKSTPPPKLFDLTSLQREANKLFGYTAQQTLDYTQALYEKKLCTYPRTDSRFLTEDMAADLPALVNAVAAAMPFMSSVRPNVNAGQVIDNSKVSDHHAVIPTASMPKADLSSLPDGERNILYLVAVRLVCAVGLKYTFAETVVAVDCGGYSLTAKGKTTLQKGWKLFENAFRSALKEKVTDEAEKEPSLPDVAEGQVFSAVAASIREGFTSPPKRFTEDTLLYAMESAGAEDMPDDAERKGLGTPATRASIIEKLIKSGFVERKGKQLVPLPKGINLIAVLPDTVKSPLLTAEWEHKLKEVERGALSADSFMEGIAAMTSGLVREHAEPNPEYASLFPRTPAGDTIGKCPRCGLSVHEGKKGFFCEDRACGFAMWKDAKFFSMKKKKLNKKTAAALIADGRVSMSSLFSQKTGKTYDAVVVLDDTGKYVNYKLDFGKGENRT
ncbi:DNA topoisomerase 3 [Oscillospiraceae bacterium OttesenSCG-928-G22]|nr:DNA topoisomerase 3 [Oscillospiraceae bacterium OttesenSCG-928-G22]